MMIEIHDLNKIYGKGSQAVKALNGIDLNIGPGMFGLLGPNGAGKTTLMRILAGIVLPSRGSVAIVGPRSGPREKPRAGQNHVRLPAAGAGHVPGPDGAPVRGLHGHPEGHAGSIRAQAAGGARCSIWWVCTPQAGRKIKGFSGGMKRRVGIAQALVNDPRMLIVDEPTAGLDPEERIRFRNLLVNLAADRTVILSTHIVEDIGQTCRDLAVLSQGAGAVPRQPGELTQAAEGHVWNVTCRRTRTSPITT